MTKKILIFPMPAMGHLNPILSVAKELRKDSNTNIVIYTTESFRKLIEQNGFIYHGFDGFRIEEIQKNLQASTKAYDAFSATTEMILTGCEVLAIKLADVIENENPDILLYDQMAVFVKFALRLLKTRYENSKFNKMIPTSIVYHTTYINHKGVFPNADEEILMMNMNFWEKIKFLYFSIKLYLRTKVLSKKLGLEHVSPQDDFIYADTSKLNIVFTFPEFQARSELCDKNVQFVGSCISDGPHLDTLKNVNDDSLKSFLQRFKAKNPTESSYNEGDDVLIYISLGSLFKDNLDFYIKAIDALKAFDEEVKSNKDPKLKPFNVYAIINVGDKCFQEFSKNSHNIPTNIKLLPFAPQLEILRRASLFVTHCGMNSTLESIWFGVPMLCVPVTVDQPLVANRAANELGLGVLLNIHTLTKDDLVNGMHKIFEDEQYQKRLFKYSQISRKYNGSKITTEIIKSYL